MFGYARRLCLSLLISLAPIAVSAELSPTTLRDFSSGLVTDKDSSNICDTCAQDLANVDVNTGSIVKRRGSTKQNTTAKLGSFTAQPTRFLHEYVDASGNFWMLAVSSATLYKSSDGGATASVATSTHGVTTSSRFSGVNAFGKARLTDGTTNWILFDGTTITVSTASPKGKTSAFFAERVLTSVGSTFYASARGNGEDWTADAGTDDDAFSTQVRQTDGYDIRCIRRFRDCVLVFKDYSIDKFTLSGDGLTFIQTPVSSSVGTQYPESVVERENDVIWLAHDGYYSYNGSTIKRISGIISNSIFDIRQLNSAENTINVDTPANWAAGTSSTLDTTTYSGSITFSVNDTTVTNNSFESVLSSGWSTNSNFSLFSGCVFPTISPQDGSKFAGTFAGGTGFVSLTVYVLDSSNNVLTSLPFTPISGWTQGSIPLSSYARRNIKIKFDYNGYYMVSDLFLASGSTMTFYHAYATRCDGIEANPHILIDNVQGGRSTIYDGSFLSGATATSGISSVGPFTADITGDATRTYTIYSDSDTVISTTSASTFISSNTVLSGGTVVITPSNYLRLGLSMSTTTATNAATVDRMQLLWYSGSNAGNTLASAISYEGDYICAVAVSSSSNDRMYIYDRNNNWTIYSSLPAYYLAKYRQKPYFGSNVQGDIVRFQVDDKYQDYDGSAISAYWTSKDFDFGYPLTDKTMERYYLTATYRASSDVTFSYGVNRGTLTTDTLDLDLTSGFARKSINPSSLTYNKGLTHQFKFSNATVDYRFDILSVTLKARLETSP